MSVIEHPEIYIDPEPAYNVQPLGEIFDIAVARGQNGSSKWRNSVISADTSEYIVMVKPDRSYDTSLDFPFEADFVKIHAFNRVNGEDSVLYARGEKDAMSDTPSKRNWRLVYSPAETQPLSPADQAFAKELLDPLVGALSELLPEARANYLSELSKSVQTRKASNWLTGLFRTS